MAAQLKFVNRHNSVMSIDVDDQEKVYYHPILRFLLRSRVHHVLTHNPPIVISYVRDFWTFAEYDSEVNPPVIRARVNERNLSFSCENLRDILCLGDAAQDNGPIEFQAPLRSGAFGRMGYSGDADRPIVKTLLFGQWRYLAHVLVQCLSARKAGFDKLNAKEQSLMIALVYNKPFDISRYFFDAFRNQVQGSVRDKFLMYPRFVMMIILNRLPDIPIVGGTVEVAAISNRIFKDCQSKTVNRLMDERPQQTDLFGHLINVKYVAPPNDGWNDPEGEVPANDVVLEVQLRQPPPVQLPPVVNQEVPQQLQQDEAQVVEPEQQQAVLEDVFHNVENPGDAQIDQDVGAVIVQEVIHQGPVQVAGQADSPEDEEYDDVFREIDNYRDVDAAEGIVDAGNDGGDGVEGDDRDKGVAMDIDNEETDSDDDGEDDQGHVQGAGHDALADDNIFHEIDNYPGEHVELEDVAHEQFDDDPIPDVNMDLGNVPGAGDNEGNNDDDDRDKGVDLGEDSDESDSHSDSDSDGDGGQGKVKFGQYGKNLVVLGPVPPTEGMPVVHTDTSQTHRSKRLQSRDIVIPEQTAPATPVAIATAAEATTTVSVSSIPTTSVTSSQPSTAIPTSSLPTATVPDVLKISELGGKFVVLNAQVISLNAQLAAQKVTHAAQIDSLTQQLDLSNSKVVSLTGQVERLIERVDAQERFILKLEDMLKKLVAQGGSITCKGDELKGKQPDDTDDDPSAPKDGELPSSSTTPLGTLATPQGESGRQSTSIPPTQTSRHVSLFISQTQTPNTTRTTSCAPPTFIIPPFTTSSTSPRFSLNELKAMLHSALLLTPNLSPIDHAILVLLNSLSQTSFSPDLSPVLTRLDSITSQFDTINKRLINIEQTCRSSAPSSSFRHDDPDSQDQHEEDTGMSK